jgi:Relaxase/Mobilisation nuclease domain
MVAKIIKGSHLSRTLNYNEQKVKKGDARCIQAANYPKDVDRLNFYDKLHRLKHQAALNERVKANSVHITLNFADADKLDREKLIEIADSYMQQIGFGKQPYLVYEHLDAGHQHIHIVTTNIRADGSRIDMQNIGRNQSEVARKRIEEIYGLVKAEGRKKTQQEQTDSAGPRRVKYGEKGTKQSISNVVEHVVKNYKFTSLGEFNAILKLYYVTADPGEKDSRLRKFKGLLYRLLDDQGNKVGAPVKASAFYHKPTISNLEKKYAQNEVFRVQHRQRLKVAIDWALRGENISLLQLRAALQKERVEMVVRHTDQGKAYGVTFVDFRTKCAFNGSDLGKEYSLNGLEKRCGVLQKAESDVKDPRIRPDAKQINPSHFSQGGSPKGIPDGYSGHGKGQSLLEILLRPEMQEEPIPYELTQDYKKKKKGHHPKF